MYCKIKASEVKVENKPKLYNLHKKRGDRMAKVGMPYLKLDRCDHFGGKEKHGGNARAVVMEGMEERQSSDPDLDRARTKDNVYYGVSSGDDLVTMWEKNADDYIITDKKGRQRHLRSNANIGFACICKPESEYINGMTPDEQARFFRDSYQVMCQMFADRGLEVDAAVIHYDESSPHMHIYGHDPEYNLGRKFDLKMRDSMNRSYYPARMRKLGWAVDDLPRSYDPDYARTLSGDDLTEYKAECRRKRKTHGASSKLYKAEKEAAKVLEDANAQAAKILEDAANQMRKVDTARTALEIREKQVSGWESIMDLKKIDLSNKQANISAMSRNLENERAKMQKDMSVRKHELDSRESDLNARESDLAAREDYCTDLGQKLLKRQMELREQYAEKEAEIKAERRRNDHVAKSLQESLKAYDTLVKYANEYAKIMDARDRRSRMMDGVQENKNVLDKFMHKSDDFSL